MPKVLSENEIAKKAIILIGLHPHISTSELIQLLEDTFYPLHPHDSSILQGRNDSHFSQKVRNLNSHYETNFFGKHVDKSGKKHGATT
jgi:preprotein translocase subunit SecY